MKYVLPAGKVGLGVKGIDPKQTLVFLLLLGLLSVVILYPIFSVLYTAFTQGNSLTLTHFLSFFQRSLFRESLWNSLFAGLVVVIFGSFIGLPLAFFLARYRFRGRALMQILGALPLVMPPFVGVVAIQLILGRSGIVNLLLLRWFGTTVAFMEGLPGVILVQTLHYWPFILLNASASLMRVDPSLEEMAQNMGAHGFRLFRKITLPLLMPGYVAGALLVFIKTVDDLGTPLMLNYTNMLAPQAYLRIMTVGVEDKAGYVIAAIMVFLSLLSLWISMKVLGRSEYATMGHGTSGTGAGKSLTGWRLAMVLAFGAVVLTVSLLPHIGIVLLSFARLWSFSVLPTKYTLSHYAEILIQTPHFIINTLVYCLLAAAFDVVLGALIAFLLIRGRIIGKGLLDLIATLPLAIPGVALAMGYLRIFHTVEIPLLGGPLTSTWLILVIAYSVRRLPYTLRSCYAAMQQIHVSLEEAAMNLGAYPHRTFLKITLPLMGGGMIAGGILSFITSSVDLSSTMMLVLHELGPLSYGIYIYMQSAVGRGPGASLGVVTILLVAAGTYAVTKAFGNRSRAACDIGDLQERI